LPADFNKPSQRAVLSLNVKEIINDMSQDAAQYRATLIGNISQHQAYDEN
jgi:hypothetical protein